MLPGSGAAARGPASPGLPRLPGVGQRWPPHQPLQLLRDRQVRERADLGELGDALGGGDLPPLGHHRRVLHHRGHQQLRLEGAGQGGVDVVDAPGSKRPAGNKIPRVKTTNSSTDIHIKCKSKKVLEAFCKTREKQRKVCGRRLLTTFEARSGTLEQLQPPLRAQPVPSRSEPPSSCGKLFSTHWELESPQGKSPKSGRQR